MQPRMDYSIGMSLHNFNWTTFRARLRNTFFAGARKTELLICEKLSTFSRSTSKSPSAMPLTPEQIRYREVTLPKIKQKITQLGDKYLLVTPKRRFE